MNPWVERSAFVAACRTVGFDGGQGQEVFGRYLAVAQSNGQAYDVVQVLAREIRHLFNAPELAESAYVLAFSHEEESDERTPMGTPVLPMASTRRQDHSLAQWQLAEAYPQFLSAAPENALRVLLVTLSEYVLRRHGLLSDAPRPFTLDEYQADLVADHSVVWDTGTYADDEPMRMLDAFMEYLRTLGTTEHREERKRVIAEIAGSRPAVLWRRLLLLGAELPTTWGCELRSMLWSPAVLSALDTIQPAGACIQAVFPILAPQDREAVERAILSLGTDTQGAGKMIRDRMLGCLPLSRVTVPETAQALSELSSCGGPPPNEPLVGPTRFEVGGSPTVPDVLAMRGVSTDGGEAKTILDAMAPLTAIVDEYMNKPLPPEREAELASALERLRSALAAEDARKIHPEHNSLAWGYLAAATNLVAQLIRYDPAHDAFVGLAETLLRAAKEPAPEPDPQQDERFAQRPWWGFPLPRIEAAKGLVLLASRPSEQHVRLRSAIHELLTDSVASVRYQVVRHAHALREVAPDQMWRILHHACRSEANPGVTQGAIELLSDLRQKFPREVAELAAAAAARQPDGNRRVGGDGFVCLLGLLAVQANEPVARSTVIGYAEDIDHLGDKARTVAHCLRNLLVLGPADGSAPETDAIRRRAIEIVSAYVRATREGFEKIVTGRDLRAHPLCEAEQASLKRILECAHWFGMELYFASGVFTQGDSVPEPLDTGQMRRYLAELGGILDDVLELGEPQATHSLLTTLEHFLSADPEAVVPRVSAAVKNAARTGNLDQDPMAVDVCVKIVSRLLAEHRTLMRENVNCRAALVEILDVFVRAGWPQAVRLTYKLDQIYR